MRKCYWNWYSLVTASKKQMTTHSIVTIFLLFTGNTNRTDWSTSTRIEIENNQHTPTRILGFAETACKTWIDKSPSLFEKMFNFNCFLENDYITFRIIRNFMLIQTASPNFDRTITCRYRHLLRFFRPKYGIRLKGETRYWFISHVDTLTDWFNFNCSFFFCVDA